YEHADRRSLGEQFVEQLQLLGYHSAAEESHPRDIARRPVEAAYEPEIHRVIAGREYDRYRRGCGLRRQRRRAIRGDHRHLSLNQIGHQRLKPIILSLGPAIFDRDVLTLNETCFLQTLAERDQKLR